jgi:hypothetical protein
VSIKDKGSVLVAATAPCFATSFFTATINQPHDLRTRAGLVFGYHPQFGSS